MVTPIRLLALGIAAAGLIAAASLALASPADQQSVAGITIPPREWGDIVFASDRADPEDGSGFDLYTMYDQGGGTVQRTSAPGDDTWPQWSREGTAIAFTSNRDGDEEIYSMHSSGEDQTNLTGNPAADRHPTWSVGGTQIAFRQRP